MATNQDLSTPGIKALMPVLVPVMSVLATVLGVAISFTKVQMESNAHSVQLTALEARIDRFQAAFDKHREESTRDNRDRDRLIERSAATNEAQTLRIDQMLEAVRRLSDFYRSPTNRPQNFFLTPDLNLYPLPQPIRYPIQEASHEALDRCQLHEDGEVHAATGRAYEQRALRSWRTDEVWYRAE